MVEVTINPVNHTIKHLENLPVNSSIYFFPKFPEGIDGIFAEREKPKWAVKIDGRQMGIHYSYERAFREAEWYELYFEGKLPSQIERRFNAYLHNQG